MTGEEAQGILFDMLGKGIYVKDTKENQAIMAGLRAIENEALLDKARAEIEQTGAYYKETGEQVRADAFLEALAIIDRCKAGGQKQETPIDDGDDWVMCSECDEVSTCEEAARRDGCELGIRIER